LWYPKLELFEKKRKKRKQKGKKREKKGKKRKKGISEERERGVRKKEKNKLLFVGVLAIRSSGDLEKLISTINFFF